MSFRPLGPALGKLLEEWLENPDARRVLLERTWERALGGEIADRCRPTGFADGVLSVEVVDDSWRPQLMDMGPELVAKVNAALGKDWVREISWVSGAD